MEEITYGIKTINGDKTIAGFKISEHISIHKLENTWVINHLPTGLSICKALSFDNAVIVANSIAHECDWGSMTIGNSKDMISKSLLEYIGDESYKHVLWKYGEEQPAQRTPPKVTRSIELGSVDFKVEELWPDGDWPETITEESVRELIEDSGGLRRFANDCDLLDNSYCEVYVHKPFKIS